MNCDQVRELLDAYVLDILDSEEWAEVEHHLLECPECRREADELAEVINRLPEALAEASPLKPPEALKSRLVTAVEARPPVTTPVPEHEVDESKEPAETIPTVQADAQDKKRESVTAAPARAWSTWLRPRTLGALVALLVLFLFIAWGARFGIALAQERAMLRSELADLFDQQELVFEVIDSDKAVRRVLLPPERDPTASAPPYGKIFTRSDLPHVVAMVARLPEPPAGQAYHLWLTNEAQTTLAGILPVNDDGFSVLVFDEETDGPTYQSAQLTLQPEGSPTPSGEPILVWEAAE